MTALLLEYPPEIERMRADLMLRDWLPLLLLPLYRYLRQLEQCQHLSVVSSDGKPRSVPLRCTHCGALAY